MSSVSEVEWTSDPSYTQWRKIYHFLSVTGIEFQYYISYSVTLHTLCRHSPALNLSPWARVKRDTPQKPCARGQAEAKSALRLITLATYLRLVLGSNQPMTYYTEASISGRRGILTKNKSTVRNAVRLLAAGKAETCRPCPQMAAPVLN